jgi:hypothetical protein
MTTIELINNYDQRGVRLFVKYADSNGKWAIECFRRKTQKELQKEFEELKISIDSNWRMVREGHVNTFNSRQEALDKALLLAEQICEKYKF